MQRLLYHGHVVGYAELLRRFGREIGNRKNIAPKNQRFGSIQTTVVCPQPSWKSTQMKFKISLLPNPHLASSLFLRPYGNDFAGKPQALVWPSPRRPPKPMIFVVFDLRLLAAGALWVTSQLHIIKFCSVTPYPNSATVSNHELWTCQ